MLISALCYLHVLVITEFEQSLHRKTAPYINFHMVMWDVDLWNFCYSLTTVWVLSLCSKSEAAYSSLKKKTTCIYHGINTGSFCRVPDIINSNYNLHLINLWKDWESCVISTVQTHRNKYPLSDRTKQTSDYLNHRNQMTCSRTRCEVAKLRLEYFS